MSTITAADCASDYALFCEFYDTGATTTRDEFDAMSYGQKWLEIAECFADNSRGTDDESRANAELSAAQHAARSGIL